MALVSERAYKGNAKAVESLCMSERGFVSWLISQLKGKYDADVERDIWSLFLGCLKKGQLSPGDPLEKALSGCAVAAVNGKSAVNLNGTDDEGGIKPIKFPGDLDAAKGYLTSIIDTISEGSKAALLLALAGFGSADAANILGTGKDEASSFMQQALNLFREEVKNLANGKYNINIPSPEMSLDILTRASGSFTAQTEPDQGIRDIITKGFSPVIKEAPKTESKDPGKPKWIRYIAALLCVALVVAAGIMLFKDKGNEPEGGTGTYDGPSEGDNGDTETENLKVIYHVVMEIKDYGTIELELDKSKAPRTVKNFVDLVERGFYDGLTFHRIMDGFMIQGGDPEGNGTGGSDKKIIGEFSANGVENTISHKRGTISMARASGDYNSARSQFFICQVDCSSSLDGQYAAFGHVTSGMEVVDQICKDAKPTDNNGTIPKSEQPVILSVKVTSEVIVDTD